MKKIFIIVFTFLSLFSFSQKKEIKAKKPINNLELRHKGEGVDRVSYLFEEDFNKKGDTLWLNKKIYVHNANEDLIMTNFEFYGPKGKLDFLTIDELNHLIHKSNLEVMYDMKNKFTYVPKKITMSFEEKSNRWYVNVIYTSENDYGGTKDGSCVLRYSFDGFLYDKNYF